MRHISLVLALAAGLAAATAHAADNRITWKDLDLATPAGRAELDRRIDSAAQGLCAPRRTTGSILARPPMPNCLAETRGKIAAMVAARTERARLAAGQSGSAAANPRH